MIRRLVTLIVLLVVAFGAGLIVSWRLTRPVPAKQPDPPALVLQMREVARLETLDVSVYKKVSFDPEPQPAGSFWGDVASWAKFTLAAPHGKAIIFADLHLGLDLTRLSTESFREQGDRIDVVLPPVQVQVELKPADTEIIGSNLDSAQTAKLFDLAKDAFGREAAADPRLNERARSSAQRAIRALLVTAGFREIRFVDTLPVASSG